MHICTLQISDPDGCSLTGNHRDNHGNDCRVDWRLDQRLNWKSSRDDEWDDHGDDPRDDPGVGHGIYWWSSGDWWSRQLSPDILSPKHSSGISYQSGTLLFLTVTLKSDQHETLPLPHRELGTVNHNWHMLPPKNPCNPIKQQTLTISLIKTSTLKRG